MVVGKIGGGFFFLWFLQWVSLGGCRRGFWWLEWWWHGGGYCDYGGG